MSVPPAVKGLEFTVLDDEGRELATDRLSAPGGIRPHSMLELGFDMGECARIQKWKVRIIDPEPDAP